MIVTLLPIALVEGCGSVLADVIEVAGLGLGLEEETDE